VGLSPPSTGSAKGRGLECIFSASGKLSPSGDRDGRIATKDGWEGAEYKENLGRFF